MFMFGESTKRFVRNSNEGLIPNTRLNDSSKLLDSTRLVIKTKPRWPFQTPSYRVSIYKLEDLFDAPPPCPDWLQTTPFVNHCGASYEREMVGKVGGDLPAAGGKVKLRDSAKLQADFGQLNKHEVDILKLKRSIKNVRMRENPELKEGESLVLVNERIYTTTPCTLKATDQVDSCFKLKGMVQVVQLLVGGAYSSIQQRSMEIPPNAVVAYSVTELKELKVPDDMESLEADGLSDDLTFLFEDTTSQDVLSRVWKALWEFEEDLQSLADLPQETKSSLFLQLRKVLKDRTDLQNLLEDTDGTTHESGIHLLVSALEELPDVARDMLTRCSPECLQELSTLVTRRKTKKPVSLESLPGPLQDGGEFNWAAEFLCSFETLPDLETLWEETGIHPGVLLLVLSIAIQGFAAVGGCSV